MLPVKRCALRKCNRMHYANGLCCRHYRRQRRALAPVHEHDRRIDKLSLSERLYIAKVEGSPLSPVVHHSTCRCGACASRNAKQLASVVKNVIKEFVALTKAAS